MDQWKKIAKEEETVTNFVSIAIANIECLSTVYQSCLGIYMHIFFVIQTNFWIHQFCKYGYRENWDLQSARAEIGEGNGNPLQYSCLENSMDGEAWWAAVHGVVKSRTRLKWLSSSSSSSRAQLKALVVAETSYSKKSTIQHHKILN